MHELPSGSCPARQLEQSNQEDCLLPRYGNVDWFQCVCLSYLYHILRWQSSFNSFSSAILEQIGFFCYIRFPVIALCHQFLFISKLAPKRQLSQFYHGEMLPMGELFYGRAEPLWILNHARDNDEDEEEKESSSTNEPEKDEYSTSSGTTEAEKQQYPTVTTSPSYPYYSPNFPYPYYQPDPYHFGSLPDNSHGSAKKEMEVVMKIPICCSECGDSIKVPLNGMEGVQSVECNIRRQKVTVVITTAAPADILMECRKVFKKSRMWNDDED